MNIYLINILRVVHIFAGALWLGTAIFYLFYITIPSPISLAEQAD